MKLVRWDPFQEFVTMSNRLNRMINDPSTPRTEKRRNRVNPRVIKVKMSKFMKKRAEHRGIPPLTRGFVQTIQVLR